MSQVVLAAEDVQAQVRRDTTLPEPTRVERQGDRTIITGGTQADTNLFHSFREFSIPRNDVASFQLPDASIRAILTRVTGTSASRINGTIEAIQPNGTVSPADFFLINPNGIIVGPRAFLNLGGSFFATTADSLIFENDTAFSAVDPQDNSLLTVNTPIGLQFGASPNTISIQDSSPSLGQGNTFVLLGGDIRFNGSPSDRPTILVPGGRVEIGSVGADSFVGLTSIETGWRLDYQDVQNFQNIQFESAGIDVSANQGGSIQLQGGQINLINAELLADTGNLNADEIRIRASNLVLEERSLISSLSSGTGRTADLYIESDRLTLRSGGRIGNIVFGSGSSGDLIVNISDAIELSGGFVSSDAWRPSGLFNQVNGSPNASGNGGDTVITTRTLRLFDGAQISSSTFSVGDAGNIRIEANRIEIEGVAIVEGEVFLNAEGLPFPSGVFAATGENSSGDGGRLRLIVDQLSVRDGGFLQTTTFGSGNAGDLFVRASEFIEVSGTDPANQLPSSLITASGGITGVLAEGFEDATGKGGTLQLYTGELRITDEGAIAVGSLNPNELLAQGSGAAIIEADRIELSNQGRILAETASADGGDIRIRAQELLFLRDNSQISTTAGTTRKGGDGGNISINSDYILTALPENSDITANAFTGAGGNISITATGIFGILPQANLTSQSDITASSQLGVDGNIEINALTIDPNRALVVLPSTLVDVQLNQRCQPGQEFPSQFVDTARGGLPPAPQDSSGSQDWEDWRLPDELPPVASQHSTSEMASVEPAAQIVEAQGWTQNENGDVVFTADSPTVIPYSSWQSPAACQDL